MTSFDDTFDNSSRPREECGVFAIYGHEDAARVTFFGLFALQHRGQESAGIVSSDGCNVSEHKGMGLASGVFKESILQNFRARWPSATCAIPQPVLPPFPMPSHSSFMSARSITRWRTTAILSMLKS